MTCECECEGGCSSATTVHQALINMARNFHTHNATVDQMRAGIASLFTRFPKDEVMTTLTNDLAELTTDLANPDVHAVEFFHTMAGVLEAAIKDHA